MHFVLARQLQLPLMWQLQFYWHGNCSCIGMATAVVPSWQLGMANVVALAWQLQLFLHGNYRCPGMATAVVQG